MVTLVLTCYDLHCYLTLVFTHVYMPSFLSWYLAIIYLSLFHYWNMCWKHYISLILLETCCWSVFLGVQTTTPTLLTRTLRGSQRILSRSRTSSVMVCRWRSLASTFPARAHVTWRHMIHLLSRSYLLGFYLLSLSYCILYIFCSRT